MNLVFSGLLVILCLIFVGKIIQKSRGKTVTDERAELVKLKASRAAFVIFTSTLAISSFMLIYFGQYGRAPADYIYYLGINLSYLTSLLLVLFLILYAYFNKQS
ncbi:DUF2178 domain-containing protein [Patescibacteria group bacterium]